jgi:serine/threonine protein phosphatase 1
MLTFAIADMHGRFDLFEKAIELIEKHSPEGGRLIVLGDFVDRGFQSCQIIQRLIQGPSSDKWEWIVLQGNHEDIMLQAARNSHALVWWLNNGGGSTLQSYGYKDGEKLTYPLRLDEDHLAWLTHLPTYFEDDKRIFVHAGVPFTEKVEDVKKQTLQWMLYEGDIKGLVADTYEDKPHVSGKHLVHGHHQSDKHPLLKPHRTNLDSFAWYTGRLAIGVFDDTQAEPIETLEVTDKSIKEIVEEMGLV